MLVVSLTGHCLLLLLLMFRPNSGPVTLPGVVAVELVSAPAAPAAPAPARPAAPPKPVAKQVVLPKEPTAPKPKPKPAKVEKPAPPPEPKPEPEVAEQDYADVMEQLRAAAGETAAAPEDTAALAAPSAGGGVGVPVSPEVAAWVRQAKIHVRRVWVLPPAFRTQALEAHVSVELDAGGNVIGAPDVVRRSGNPWYDEGVVRAIQKASPLPPPPAAGEWSFVFVPGDSY